MLGYTNNSNIVSIQLVVTGKAQPFSGRSIDSSLVQSEE